MIPALDGVVSFNFASQATAPKRSKNAKRRCIQDRADVVVVVSLLLFYFSWSSEFYKYERHINEQNKIGYRYRGVPTV